MFSVKKKKKKRLFNNSMQWCIQATYNVLVNIFTLYVNI